MISIIAYANYKVIRKVKFDSIDRFVEGQPIYKKEHIKKTYHISGGELIDMIIKDLQQDYFCSLDIKENKICITLFNYNNGMGEDITYEYSINNNML